LLAGSVRFPGGRQGKYKQDYVRIAGAPLLGRKLPAKVIQRSITAIYLADAAAIATNQALKPNSFQFFTFVSQFRHKVNFG
jgi:hypothetical protein